MVQNFTAFDGKNILNIEKDDDCLVEDGEYLKQNDAIMFDSNVMFDSEESDYCVSEKENALKVPHVLNEVGAVSSVSEINRVDRKCYKSDEEEIFLLKSDDEKNISTNYDDDGDENFSPKDDNDDDKNISSKHDEIENFPPNYDEKIFSLKSDIDKNFSLKFENNEISSILSTPHVVDSIPIGSADSVETSSCPLNSELSLSLLRETQFSSCVELSQVNSTQLDGTENESQAGLSLQAAVRQKVELFDLELNMIKGNWQDIN